MTARGLSRREHLRRQREAAFRGRRSELAAFRDNLADGPDSEAFRFAFHVHGNGGVGKTTLVRQWEREAARRGAVTAYSDEEVHSPVAAMALVADALRQQGAELKAFDRLLARYRQRQHEATGALAVPFAGADPRPGSPAAPGTSPAAVTATRLALAGASLLPGVAPFAGAVDPAQAAQAMERARSMLSAQFRSHEDVRLVLSPERVLTPVLLADLTAVAAQHPYVMLTFDTWEQTRPVLDAWLRAVVLDGTYGDLPLNVVTVTAGRERLGAGWRGAAEQIGLDVFTEDEARQLLSAKGVVDESRVQRILRISGRLPVLVAMLAQGGPAGGEAADDAADTAVELFLKWETDPARRAAALLCALPLHLNEDIFHAALTEPLPDGYTWLRGLAFVTEQDGRLRYHDIVRRTMGRLQRTRAPRRWSADHERLAAVFHGWRIGHETGPGGDGTGPGGDDLWREAEWQDALLHETFHALCAHPRQALPGAVDPLVRACGQGLAVLRRWAHMLDDAARSTEHDALAGLAGRLADATATDAPDTVRALGILLAVPDVPAATRALAFALRGLGHRGNGRYDDALTDYDAALGLQRDLAPAHAGRGETYRLCHRYAEALTDFDRAIAIDPGDERSIASRAQVHAAQGRPAQALADYSRAIAIDPGYRWAIGQRAALHETMGNDAEALADYGRAIEIAPEYRWAVAQRGALHQSRGRFAEALADFDRAIEIAPEYRWAIAQRGTLRQAMGDYAEALADFDRAIEIAPEYRWAITRRGALRQAMGDYAEALADFDRAVEADPADALAATLRGALHQAMGHPADALADFDRAVGTGAGSDTALVLRGEAHLAAGRYEDAFADLDRACSLVDDDPWRTYLKALAVRRLGRGGADELLRSALDGYRRRAARGTDPDVPTAGLVLVHGARGDWDAAEAQVNALRGLVPSPHVRRELRRNLGTLADVFPSGAVHVDRLRALLPG